MANHRLSVMKGSLLLKPRSKFTGGELVLTIDAGGSGVRATVFSAARGRVLARTCRTYQPTFHADGRVEFDPVSWWAVIVAACRDAVARTGAPPSAYAGITCAGMRAPFVLIDAAGQPLGSGVLVADRRGATELAEIEQMIGRRELYERTGHWLSSRFGLPKLLWFARHAPEVFTRVRRVLQFHDWLIYSLSGVTISEPSSASMSQLLDVRRRQWSGELLAALGIAESLLPPLVDAGDRVGGLLREVAAAVGLRPGTPVHAGGGDTHLGALGAGGAEPGTIAVVAGSTTAVQLTGDAVTLEFADAAPLVSAHLQPGRFASETNAGETGVMYQWLRETLAWDADAASFDALAAGAPMGAGGVLITAAQPRWGEAAWSRLAPVTVFGVGPQHGPGHLARAAVEGAAYSTAAAVEVLTRGLEAPIHIRALGGASHSELWAQTVADVGGREVEVSGQTDPVARAGALLVCPGARVGEGETQVQDEGESLVGGGGALRVYSPDPERQAAYARLAARYAEVFSRLDATFGEPA